MKTKIAIGLLAAALVGGTMGPAWGQLPEGPKVIGYFPYWRAGEVGAIQRLPADRLTHLVYAFAKVDPTGEVAPRDPALDLVKVFPGDAPEGPHGVYHQIALLKKRYPHLRTLISLGGWKGSSGFSQALRTEASRARCAQSCVALLELQREAFDGLDLDWEFPVSGGAAPASDPGAYDPADKQNLTLFVQQLRQRLDDLGRRRDRPVLLTMAGPASERTMANFQWPSLVSSLDWVGVMAYDLHGGWSRGINFNAPLGAVPGDPDRPGLTVEEAVKRYRAQGVAPSRLVLGVPFYGLVWHTESPNQSGLFGRFQSVEQRSYRDLLEMGLPPLRQWDSRAASAWVADPSRNRVITYDDPASMRAKGSWASERGLAGAMVWEVGGDDDRHAMLDALRDGLGAR